MIRKKTHLLIDALVIIFSIILTVVLVRSGWLEHWLAVGNIWLNSFMAGIFFTSIFTAVPATASLVQLTQNNSVWLVAFIGSLGALGGDLFIFNFIKDRLKQDIIYLLSFNQPRHQRIKVIFKQRLFHWLLPLVGALVVASPLPDELGLVLLGLSKIKRWLFIIISLALNFLGILCIGVITNIIS